MLEHPQKLSDLARDNLRAEWNAIHQGPDNAGKIAILWEGMKFNPISATNVESEWIEAKKMSVYEAAALLNLPPHKLGALQDSSVRANLEEQNADYVNRTLNRWYTRLDHEFRRKLLRESEWQSGQYRFKPDIAAFMEGDLDTKSVIADRNMKATIWNSNEARQYLGYPPREGGEVYGSPAINPNGNKENSPSSAGKTPKEPAKPPKVADYLPQDAKIVAAVNLTLAREREALQSASRTKKNFIGWVDGFYGRPTKPGRIFDALDDNIAKCEFSEVEIRQITSKFRNWIAKRKKAVLALCDSVNAKELPEAIENFTTAGEQGNLLAYIKDNEWRLEHGTENN